MLHARRMLLLGAGLLVWTGFGVAAGVVPARLGYRTWRWRAIGAVLGPLVLVAFAFCHVRRRAGFELVESGWPPGARTDLLVVPARGPTPDLLRALAALDSTVRRVAIARVVPVDAPRREVDAVKENLRGDRGALGLPRAELVLLRGRPRSAVAEHADTSGVKRVLADGAIGLGGDDRVLHPADLAAQERPRTVRLLHGAP